jgi:hypothetical protein
MNENAELAIEEAMKEDPKLKVTMPNHANEEFLDSLVGQYYKQ